LREDNEAGNEEPQPQNKRGRLTTLRVSSEAENPEPQPDDKRGKSKELYIIYVIKESLFNKILF